MRKKGRLVHIEATDYKENLEEKIAVEKKKVEVEEKRLH